MAAGSKEGIKHSRPLSLTMGPGKCTQKHFLDTVKGYAFKNEHKGSTGDFF